MKRQCEKNNFNHYVVKAIDDSSLDNLTRITKIESLLSKGADVNYIFRNHKTPVLMYAVYRDNLEIAELLLAYGANPLLRDGRGDTCLTLAKNLDMIRLFLNREIDINALGNQGKTVLLKFSELAARDKRNVNGYLDIVRLLLENGADVNQVDNFGNSPFDFAERYENTELLELLQGFNTKTAT